VLPPPTLCVRVVPAARPQEWVCLPRSALSRRPSFRDCLAAPLNWGPVPAPRGVSPAAATMATLDMRGGEPASGSSGKTHYDPVSSSVAAGAATGMDDFDYGTSVGTSDKFVRLQFLRKVYTILSMQLALTVAVAAVFMLSDSVRHFVIAANGPMTIVGLIATLGFLFALMAYKDKHPLNLYLLAGFTAAESYMVGTVCAIYQEQGIGDLVLEAFALTMLVFVSLTIYCFVSKRDFSFLGGFLFAGLIIMVGASVLNLLLGLGGAQNSTFSFAISVAGALLFTGYILYDTSVIMNQLGPDEWAIAAVNLYVRLLVGAFLCEGGEWHACKSVFRDGELCLATHLRRLRVNRSLCVPGVWCRRIPFFFSVHWLAVVKFHLSHLPVLLLVLVRLALWPCLCDIVFRSLWFPLCSWTSSTSSCTFSKSCLACVRIKALLWRPRYGNPRRPWATRRRGRWRMWISLGPPRGCPCLFVVLRLCVVGW